MLAGARAEEAKDAGDHTSTDTYTILSSYYDETGVILRRSYRETD